MNHPPFRRGPKIGPNDKCPCGNGRKYKKCHGRVDLRLPNLLAKKSIEEQIVERGRQMFEEHKVRELQRQKQQGLGRPIISTEFQGYRFVAVGSKMWWGRWKTFPDFLGAYIKKTLGESWGNSEIAKPVDERHPILQWYDRMARLQQQHAKAPGEPFVTPSTGAMSAYTRLAYNLYLIAHNATDVQTTLLNRLRDPENFQGAFFETQVAAWMINAGFELEYEDETDTSRKHGEFIATYPPTGDKYFVEAKSRMRLPGGRAPTNLPIVRQLKRALEKKTNLKRLVFIELHKAIHTEEEAHRLMDKADYLIDRAEPVLAIDGQPAPWSYLCLTNLSDIYALDSTNIGTMVMFRGFKTTDFIGDEFETIRAAVRAREKHLPLFQLLKSMEAHREVPATFDGRLPSEVFAKNPPPRIRIGGMYQVPGPGGQPVVGQITQALVQGDKAVCAFHDSQTGQAWLGTFDMTPAELADYAAHPETYFGVQQNPNRKAETAIDLFDFFFESFKNTPQEKLLEAMKQAPDIEQLELLPQIELAEIHAERTVYGAINAGFQPRSRKDRQQKGRPRPKKRNVQ
jgi:SEC-C motif-containing protein